MNILDRLCLGTMSEPCGSSVLELQPLNLIKFLSGWPEFQAEFAALKARVEGYATDT